MALSDILEKIKKETEAKMANLEKEFEAKKKVLEEKYEKKQKDMDENLNTQIKEKSVKIMEKATTLAEMEGKNALLKAKREIIEQALEEAIEELAKSGEYESLLTQMLKKTDLDEEEIEVIPAKGKEQETKKALSASGKKYRISDKSKDLKGGFVLKGKKVEIDNSFETIIKEQLREELEITINKLLFA